MKLFGLTSAHIGSRVWSVSALKDSGRRVGSRSVYKTSQLVELLLGILEGLRWDGNSDQDDPLPYGAIDETQTNTPMRSNSSPAISKVPTRADGPTSFAPAGARITSRSPPGLCTITLLEVIPQ